MGQWTKVYWLTLLATHIVGLLTYLIIGKLFGGGGTYDHYLLFALVALFAYHVADERTGY